MNILFVGYVWVQPRNQGAYSHVATRIQQLLPTQLEYVEEKSLQVLLRALQQDTKRN